MLKACVADLASVDEQYRSLYREVTEDGHPAKGRYVLAVAEAEGMSLANVVGLRNALDSERARHVEATKKLRDFEGLDAADVREKLAKLEDLLKIDPQKQGEELARERIEQIKTAAARDIEKIKRASEETEKKLRDALEKHVRRNAATQALLKHGGDVEVLLPHVLGATKIVEQDGDFVVQVVGPSGLERIVDSTGQKMTLDDLVLGMKANDSFGRNFAASGNTGGGARPNGASGGGGSSGVKNPWKAGQVDVTEQMRLVRTNPALANQMRIEAGLKPYPAA